MTYQESDYLLLSGLQHFAFCRRQWALIHIEQQWAENGRTAAGQIFHQKAHDAHLREKRGHIIIFRGLRVASSSLGVTGQCDVVEFHRSAQGVSLAEEDGLWLPYPIEYKRGEPKCNDADRLQLCAQAMCLEEQLCCDIPQGALFYGQTRHRETVDFTQELRTCVKACLEEMHQMFQRGYTPKVHPGKRCNACSLKDLCLPALERRGSVLDYLQKSLEEQS